MLPGSGRMLIITFRLFITAETQIQEKGILVVVVKTEDRVYQIPCSFACASTMHERPRSYLFGRCFTLFRQYLTPMTSSARAKAKKATMRTVVRVLLASEEPKSIKSIDLP